MHLAQLKKISSLKLIAFGYTAGIGWLIDFTLFSLLIFFRQNLIFAYIIGATAGVTYTYFMSTRRVFYYQGNFLFSKFVVYVIYNAISIFLTSIIIHWLVISLNSYPLLAKIIITPFTFYSNFLFMGLILHYRIKFV